MEQNHLVLTANENLGLGRLVLDIGDVNATVTIAANGARVEVVNSENSALLTSKQVEQISVKGRDVVSLLRQVPGASYDPDIETLAWLRLNVAEYQWQSQYLQHGDRGWRGRQRFRHAFE